MYTPVQVSRYEHGYTRPHARLVSRSMEHHGRAELALRIADIVQMGVDYRNFERITMPVLAFSYGGRSSSSSCCGQMELEERKGRKTRTTGAGEVRAGFERLVGEPKGISFEKGKCGAGMCDMEGEGNEVGGLASWHYSPPVENRTKLAC